MPRCEASGAHGGDLRAVETLAAGRYELGEVLGRGGLAVTRRAVDRRLGRSVAVKSLVPDPSPEVAAAQRAKFVREARALARFDHRGIVRVYEVFEEGGTAHLVTDLLDGPTLATLGRTLRPDEAIAVAADLGAALAVVHGAGMLHRDVSPSNVVLVHGRPVLIDFGLARVAADLTQAFTQMVTPGFAPPEQYGGDPSRVGPATDVYGLAATLYAACAGRLPPSAVDRQHGAVLEPLRRLRPDLSRTFCDGVHDGLELSPSHRPTDIPTFLARLGVGRPSFVVEYSPPREPNPTMNVRDVRWAAVVPLVLLAVAAGVAMPLVGTVFVAAVALPVVATVGDRVRGRRRLAVPWRVARNVAASVVACIPALLVVAGGAAASWFVDRAGRSTSADDVVAAAAGIAGVLIALHRMGVDHDAMAAWSRRCRDGLLYAVWALGLLALMGALALRPDLWPLPPP